MSWSRDRLGAVVLLILFVTYGVLSRNIELLPVQQAAALTARTLPHTFTVLGIIGAVWLAIFPPDSKPLAMERLHWPRFIAFLVLMSVYGMVLRPIGFVLATLVFLSVGFMLLGERKWLPLTLTAVSVTVLFWLLMTWGLGVHLPPLPALVTTS